MRPKPHITSLRASVRAAQRRNVSMLPKNEPKKPQKPQRISEDMPDNSNKLLRRLKKLFKETLLPQSILGIWMLYQMQFQSLSAKVKSFFSRMTGLKRTSCQRVKETYSTAVLPVVEKVLHFLLIRYVTVTILIIVVFFSVVHSTNLPNS